MSGKTISTENTGITGTVLYRLYTFFGTCCFLLFYPLSPLVKKIGGRFAYGLDERLGQYHGSASDPFVEKKRIWLHAASVGEVQVAENLITELNRHGDFYFFITVMTEQGRKIAQKKFSESVTCLMAPLDVPCLVRRALSYIRPDIFVCVETELWPALLGGVHGAGVAMVLVNGRLSERSFRRYEMVRGLMRRLLAGFSAVSVIRPQDGERFAALGAPGERIQVSGNSKFSYQPADWKEVRNRYRRRLGLGEARVFICGSTRTGEEELLLPVYEKLRAECRGRLVWIIAPRHLERIPSLLAFFARKHLDAALFTRCPEGKCPADILIVDCMGELADLYATGDFNFCGGSLVGNGGHNIMEAVRWGRPVFFGPHMQDFTDAVGMVVSVDAGFQVVDADELAALLVRYLRNGELYEQACQAARKLSGQQCVAVREQAEMICRLLSHLTGRF